MDISLLYLMAFTKLTVSFQYQQNPQQVVMSEAGKSVSLYWVTKLFFVFASHSVNCTDGLSLVK